MVSVRSLRICTLMDDGSECCNCGSSLLMLSATEIMLAPGWRCTFTIPAGFRFIHSACLLFSVPSITVAISDSRTGAPLR